jgi:hypothetical protein
MKNMKNMSMINNKKMIMMNVLNKIANGNQATKTV